MSKARRSGLNHGFCIRGDHSSRVITFSPVDTALMMLKAPHPTAAVLTMNSCHCTDDVTQHCRHRSSHRSSCCLVLLKAGRRTFLHFRKDAISHSSLVRFFFSDKFTLGDAIGSHACSLEALTCVWPMAFLSGVHSSYRFTL
jgi:hypothetical protein